MTFNDWLTMKKYDNDPDEMTQWLNYNDWLKTNDEESISSSISNNEDYY